MIRRGYVAAARGVAAVAGRTRVDDWLARRRSPSARHLRSLLAIYDVEGMIRLGLPWWTYAASRDVERFLADRRGRARVFEYGAGASTCWLGARAGEVHSIEHSGEFVEVLRPHLEGFDHVELRWVPPTTRHPGSTAVSDRPGHRHLDFGAYAASIDQAGGEFDLVVVDGRARAACLAAALPHLAADGWVVFDNARRARYRSALGRSGLAVELHRGWAPALPYREATAILRRCA